MEKFYSNFLLCYSYVNGKGAECWVVSPGNSEGRRLLERSNCRWKGGLEIKVMEMGFCMRTVGVPLQTRGNNALSVSMNGTQFFDCLVFSGIILT
jgi:hypothetical protein